MTGTGFQSRAAIADDGARKVDSQGLTLADQEPIIDYRDVTPFRIVHGRKRFEKTPIRCRNAAGDGNHAQRLAGADLSLVVDLCCGMGGLSVAAREMGMRVVAA